MFQNNLSAMEGILRNSKFIQITTINEDGYPETRAMLNLVNKDICPHLQNYYANKKEILKDIYFTTNLSSKKTKQIINNPKTSVYFYAPDNFGGVLLLGNADIITDQEMKDLFWDDSWSMYYPDGKSSPDYAVIRFSAQKYKFYDGKFSVVEGKL